jgi:hypothetical protein
MQELTKKTKIVARTDAPQPPSIFIGLEDLSKLSGNDLLKEETAKNIQGSILELEYSGDWGESLDYHNQLDRFIKRGSSLKENQVLIKQYQISLQLALWVAFAFLSTQDQVGLLKENLYLALFQYVNIRKKIYDRLSLENELPEVHKVRLGYINAMRSNTELIGKQAISVSGLKEKQKSTIQNWLADYDQKFEREQGRAAIEEAEYVNTDANAKGLTEAEKKALRKLLQVYDFLFFPDLQEDVLPQTAELQTRSAQGSVSLRGSVLAQSTNTYDYSNVLLARNQILTQSKADQAQLVGALQKSIASSEVSQALAALLVMAQLRTLDDLLVSSQALYRLVADDLQESGQDDRVQGLRINPKAPQFLARFLKIVMEDKLNLPHKDAIAFGSKLSQILAMEGEKYQSIIKNNKWNI